MKHAKVLSGQVQPGFKTHEGPMPSISDMQKSGIRAHDMEAGVLISSEGESKGK